MTEQVWTHSWVMALRTIFCTNLKRICLINVKLGGEGKSHTSNWHSPKKSWKYYFPQWQRITLKRVLWIQLPLHQWHGRGQTHVCIHPLSVIDWINTERFRPKNDREEGDVDKSNLSNWSLNGRIIKCFCSINRIGRDPGMAYFSMCYGPNESQNCPFD